MYRQPRSYQSAYLQQALASASEATGKHIVEKKSTMLRAIAFRIIAANREVTVDETVFLFKRIIVFIWDKRG